MHQISCIACCRRTCLSECKTACLHVRAICLHAEGLCRGQAAAKALFQLDHIKFFCHELLRRCRFVQEHYFVLRHRIHKGFACLLQKHSKIISTPSLTDSQCAPGMLDGGARHLGFAWAWSSLPPALARLMHEPSIHPGGGATRLHTVGTPQHRTSDMLQVQLPLSLT